jgi:hypothetical protein
MATVTTNYTKTAPEVATSKADQVRNILHWTYGLVPIAAGADKFLNILTDWSKYLAPPVTDILPVSASAFMMIVGVIEIIAGILVLVKPKIGSLIVAGWLVAIAINLVVSGQYFDIAVRDIVMAIGAYSLFALSNDNR